MQNSNGFGVTVEPCLLSFMKPKQPSALHFSRATVSIHHRRIVALVESIRIVPTIFMDFTNISACAFDLTQTLAFLQFDIANSIHRRHQQQQPCIAIRNSIRVRSNIFCC
jgi:hypothetical protein